MQVGREEVYLNSASASTGANPSSHPYASAANHGQCTRYDHCVDLMALFTEVATLVVRACAKHLMVTKVYTLGSGTLWYTIGYILAVGCSDSDGLCNATGFYLKLKMI